MRYPAPDRSNVALDANEGSLEGLLAGSRPYRIEGWSQDGNRFLTIFFSDVDIEDASADSLLQLLEPALSGPLVVRPKWRRLEQADVHRINDARGNEMYSLTFVVIRAGED